MPYVNQTQRDKYYKITQVIKSSGSIETKGDLEYLVFVLMKTFVDSRKYNYSNLHDCVYAVIHAGEEFKRRYLDVRENEAIIENGDI